VLPAEVRPAGCEQVCKRANDLSDTRKHVERSLLVLSTQPLSPSASCLLSSSFLHRSRSSHSDASLCASSSAGAGTRLPTSVVERKSNTGWLQLVSASSSRILNRSFPPVSLRASAHRIFCWALQRGQFEDVFPRLFPMGTTSTRQGRTADKNVRRHSLDRLNASMSKQKKPAVG
jgi:hypothetical protein